MRTRIRLPALTLCVAGLLASSACGGDAGSSATDATADDSAGTSTGTTAPGEAECTFDGELQGKASVKETADAYEVTFTGQPVHPRSRSIYAMSVSGGDAKSVSLQIRFDQGKLSGYGVVDNTAELRAVPGKPTVSGDAVSGTFPKSTEGLEGMKVTHWAPDVSFLDEAGEQGKCDGGVMQKLTG